MSILIIGGTGRVGREVTLTLRKRGFSVTAMLRGGRNHTGSMELLDAGVNVIEGDLCSPASLSRAIQGIETIFCSALQCLPLLMMGCERSITTEYYR